MYVKDTKCTSDSAKGGRGPYSRCLFSIKSSKRKMSNVHQWMSCLINPWLVIITESLIAHCLLTEFSCKKGHDEISVFRKFRRMAVG